MKIYDREFINDLLEQADIAPRRRSHHLIHDSHDDPVQRLLVALSPGTYFRPHCHPLQRELVVILRGRLAMLVFDDDGTVLERYEMTPDELPVLEHPAGNWHACVVLEPQTLFLEVKKGPFMATTEENFAAWAPPENSVGSQKMVAWYQQAQPGEQAPDFLSSNSCEQL